MKVGDYYVMTRHCRADGTIEFVSRTERTTTDREQAAREARGNARRLAGDGRDFGVEVHEVLAIDGGGAGTEFASVYAIERARPAAGPTPGAASHQERGRRSALHEVRGALRRRIGCCSPHAAFIATAPRPTVTIGRR
jgi:hypothetical protein